MNLLDQIQLRFFLPFVCVSIAILFWFHWKSFLFQVDDQMKLLQNSWSDMLVLDHLHHRIHNNLPDETPLHNGQKFDLLGLGLLGVPQLADHFNEIQNKLQELKFDVGDYICMKFLLLLNPGKRFSCSLFICMHSNDYLFEWNGWKKISFFVKTLRSNDAVDLTTLFSFFYWKFVFIGRFHRCYNHCYQH